MVIKEKKSGKLTNVGVPTNLANYQRTEFLRILGKQRGQRIRTLREILNLTVEEFAKLLSMNPGGLGRAERGECCLTIDMANMIHHKLIEYDKVKLMVKPSWLLNGQKGGIEFLSKDEININDQIKAMVNGDPELKEKAKETINSMSLFLESYAFKQFNKNSVVCYVKDNKMSPIINRGEYVGGKLINSEDYNKLDGEISIVEVKKKIYLVRRVTYIEGDLLLTSDDKSRPQLLKINPENVFSLCWRRINDQKGDIEREICNKDLLIEDIS